MKQKGAFLPNQRFTPGPITRAMLFMFCAFSGLLNCFFRSPVLGFQPRLGHPSRENETDDAGRPHFKTLRR